MTSYKKIINIITNYLNKETTSKNSIQFCNEYMDTFYESTDELEREVPQKTFELLDDINLTCDSYESNKNIRNDDKFCIDEFQLKEKISKYFNIMNMLK